MNNFKKSIAGKLQDIKGKSRKNLNILQWNFGSVRRESVGVNRFLAFPSTMAVSLLKLKKITRTFQLKQKNLPRSGKTPMIKLDIVCLFLFL